MGTEYVGHHSHHQFDPHVVKPVSIIVLIFVYGLRVIVRFQNQIYEAINAPGLITVYQFEEIELEGSLQKQDYQSSVYELGYEIVFDLLTQFGRYVFELQEVSQQIDDHLYYEIRQENHH